MMDPLAAGVRGRLGLVGGGLRCGGRVLLGAVSRRPVLLVLRLLQPGSLRLLLLLLPLVARRDRLLVAVALQRRVRLPLGGRIVRRVVPRLPLPVRGFPALREWFVGCGRPSDTFPPPSVTLQPPSVTLQPPSVTLQPPSVTLQPPSVTPQPPSVTLQPPSVTLQPPSVTL